MLPRAPHFPCLADLQEIDARASDSDKGLCQYAVEDEGEAIARGGDPSIPGTTVTVTNLDYGTLVLV